MKNKKNNNKVNNGFNNKLCVILISVLVFLICCIFISLKQNFHIDEICSYGLANNQFQLLIDDYKSYSGSELVRDYLAVHTGNAFNIKRVFFNQAMDTHPPFWYLTLHFFCSIFPETFSKWYGLIINAFLMVFVFWLMKDLVYKITKNKFASFFIPFCSLALKGFINSIVFTRMYIMLEVFSLVFLKLVIEEILYIRHDNTNIDETKNSNCIKQIIINNKFFILFYLLVIFGTLTHYHFMVIAGFISIIFGLFLLKRKKFIIFIKTFLSGIFGLLTVYLIFPSIITHLFYNNDVGYSFGRVMAEVETNLNFPYFLRLLENSFFGLMPIFIIIVFIVLVSLMYVVIKLKINSSIDVKKFILSDTALVLLILFSTCVFYYVVMSLTILMRVARYLFNIFPIFSVFIFSSLFLLYNNFKNSLKYLWILILVVSIISSNIYPAPNLYYNNKEMIEFMDLHKDIKTIMLYYADDKVSQIWKLPYPMYAIKNMDEVIFVNTAKDNWQVNEKLQNNDNLLVYIYTNMEGLVQNDNDLLSKISKENNLENSLPIYRTTYVHLYMLY